MINMIKKIYFLKNFSMIYGVSCKKVKNLSQKLGVNPLNKDFKVKKKK